jgi:holliday junction DNA helicase RuvA
MIAFLEGKFVFKSPAMVHMEVGGVGYEVLISLNTYSKIQDIDQGLLHTCLLIREDAHILVGFFEVTEKEMFMSLISVSGIGATTARIMLSYMKPEEIARAIVTSDSKTLESVKGIGKKTAERMVLELKDKLAKHSTETNISPLKYNTLHTDALNALMALGIARNTADQAIKRVIQTEPHATVEEVIKKVLKTL